MTLQPLPSRRLTLGLAAAVGAALVTGCGSSDSSDAEVGPEIRGAAARMPAAPVASTASNLARFSAALLRAAAPGAQNAVISPYSVLCALGMAELGADGAALAAMTKVLGADGPGIAGQVTAVDAAIMQAVAASKDSAQGGRTKPATVAPANSLFVQHGTRLRPAFIDAVTAGYDTPLYTTDFKADPEKSRKQINGWVSGKTHKLIPELLGEGLVTDDWRLALVNALYLKAQWATELDASSDKTPFTTAEGTTVQVALLQAGGRRLAYAQGPSWQAASLPYVGNRLVMTLIVPTAGAYDTVVKSLDGPMLTAACSGQERMVDLSLPGFKTDFHLDLTGRLKAMGMAPAFDVDLPLVSQDPEPLQMKKVIHQARISVDEHGTEAAAATVVGMEAGAAPAEPEVELTVDRPFLYVIHDTTTRCPLFLGQVTDPTV